MGGGRKRYGWREAGRGGVKLGRGGTRGSERLIGLVGARGMCGLGRGHCCGVTDPIELVELILEPDEGWSIRWIESC